MSRKVDDKTYLGYLLQSLNVNELKQICRDFQIKGFSKLKKAELIDFILDSLAEEEIGDILKEKELGLISKEINIAFDKINGKDRETVKAFKIVNPEEHEVEIEYKGFNWEVTSYLSITPKTIHDPERDCDCRIGSNSGFCSHFWIGFIFSLKQDYFKLKDWNLTLLPDDFEKRMKSIKLTTTPEGAEKQEGVSLIDETSDNSVLMKYLDKSITIYEGIVTDVVQRQSEFQENITIYYHVSLADIRLGPKITKKSDFNEEDIVKVDQLQIRISEKLQNDNNLEAKDKIKVNGKLVRDNFWGIMVKNIRKILKI
jgi:hypothetical protein